MQKKLLGLLGAILVLGVLLWFGLAPVPVPPPPPPSSGGSVEHPVVATSSGARPSMIPRVLPGEENRSPPDAGVARAPVPPLPAEIDPLADVDVRDASDTDRERLQVPRKYGHGVILSNVGPDSPAALSALRDDDVIVRAQRTDVNTVEDLRSVVHDREHTMLIVSRDGRFFEIVIHRPESH